MKSNILSVLILINFLIICSATSQTLIIKEKTLANDKELVGAVVAKIEDVAWIKGHWKGEAFGGNAEEIWSEPAGGAIMGMFRLTSDGKTSFYELMVIREVNNSLILQLKHFHHDMKGWEEKDQTVDFPLIKIEEKKIWFDGLTFEHINENQMIVNVIIEDSQPEGVDFVYYRQ